MKIDLLDNIKVRILGREPYRHHPRVSNVGFEQSISECEPNLMRFDASVTIHFQQTADNSTEAQKFVRSNAVNALARYVYGPIEQELQELREMVYESEVYIAPNDPIHAKISEILDAIKNVK